MGNRLAHGPERDLPSEEPSERGPSSFVQPSVLEALSMPSQKPFEQPPPSVHANILPAVGGSPPASFEVAETNCESHQRIQKRPGSDLLATPRRSARKNKIHQSTTILTLLVPALNAINDEEASFGTYSRSQHSKQCCFL